MGLPSNEEQLTLELINRFRLDPDGEYARLVGKQANVDFAISFFGVTLSALQTQLAALSPVAPLAWNSALNDSATTHSQLMINANSQSHNLPGEPSLGQRFENAGYTGYQLIGENIYYESQDVFYGHAGFIIDWGYDDVDNNGANPNWQTAGDGIQDPPGHRNSLINSTFTEIGIGIIPNNGTLSTTHHLGHRFAYQAQFVGVVIDDADNDDFYDVGEGLGGVTVTLTSGGSTFTTTTWSSGGYQIAVPNGTYTITFSGGGLSAPIVRTATLAGANVKVDANADDVPAGPTNGNDDLVGTNSPDVIDLLAGNDKYQGLGGNDIIRGNAGNDTLNGGGENDSLYGGADADAHIGGAGIDYARYDDANWGNLRISLAAPATNTGAAAGDTYSGIEGIIAGAGNDYVIGNGEANYLYGLGGNDHIYGGAGADRIDGGAGLDYARYDDANYGNLRISLKAPATNTGAAAGDTYNGIEGVVAGAGNDVVVGDNANNYLYGLGGNDTLYGGGGRDVLVGGDGIDYARYDDANWGNLVISLLNPAANTGAAAGDTFSGIEGIVAGAGNDAVIGNSANNYLYGLGGNDTLYGGGGRDVLVGGDGIDYARYDDGNWGNLVISLLSPAANTGAAAGDTFSGIEGIFAGAGNDRIDGNAFVNYLYGAGGNDTIASNDGNDTVSGGAGLDAFVFNSALNASTNIDRILDFNVADDTIWIDQTFFGALAVGALNADNFRVGAAAADSNDRIIYNSATGALIFDANGNAAGGATQFATLTAGLALTAADFQVIA